MVYNSFWLIFFYLEIFVVQPLLCMFCCRTSSSWRSRTLVRCRAASSRQLASSSRSSGLSSSSAIPCHWCSGSEHSLSSPVSLSTRSSAKTARRSDRWHHFKWIMCWESISRVLRWQCGDSECRLAATVFVGACIMLTILTLHNLCKEVSDTIWV